MNGIARGIGITTVGAALLAGLVFVCTAPAQGVGNRPPTVVATIDLGRIFSNLNQRSHAEAALNTMGEATRDEDTRRQNEINALIDALPDVTDPAEQRRIENERDLKLLERAGWLQFTMSEIDIEKALLWEDLFRNVNEAIADLAVQGGIDLVIASDAGRDLTINPDMQVSREAQVQQQIQSRRFFYASPSIDITEDLIIRMNNAFEAGAP